MPPLGEGGQATASPDLPLRRIQIFRHEIQAQLPQRPLRRCPRRGVPAHGFEIVLHLGVDVHRAPRVKTSSSVNGRPVTQVSESVSAEGVSVSRANMHIPVLPRRPTPDADPAHSGRATRPLRQ